MKTFLECVPCALRQTLEAARMATDNYQTQEQILRTVLVHASKMSFDESPPHLAQQIHRLIRELAGNADPYHGVKKRFNKEVMAVLPSVRLLVEQSGEPFLTALRCAIAGNIIDFGVGNQEQICIKTAIEHALTEPLAINQVAALEEAISNARNILYLGDNAGEIVLDRLLLEQLPRERVTFVVKGSPILNDSTMEDAVETGITELVEVIDNGSDAPGTILETCSEAFRERFEQADLVISKGQGNYETLNEIKDPPIFFLLKVKCPVISRDLGCALGSLVVTRTEF